MHNNMEFDCNRMHISFPKLTLHQNRGPYMAQNLIYYLVFEENRERTKVQIHLLFSVPTKLIDLMGDS